MDKKTKSLHYVAHTHWDKEWYKTYEEFRVKFIKYFREIIEVLENDKEFLCFMFDGQSSIVDDYLQIYPEQYEKISQLVKNKKLLIGPWYTLPDNYLTSGESLSRNLLIGSNYAEQLGHSQEVCYIPDSFGQTDMMPQIIKELELKGAILWRGVDSTMTNNAGFSWEGSSGDEVSAVHLSLGYGYSKNIPEDGTHFEYINDIYNLLSKKYSNDIVLFMGGSDHQPIQKELPNLLKDINKRWEDENFQGELKISSIDEFFDDFWNNNDKAQFTKLKGELRSVKDQRVHYGDASGRADLKKLNRIVEHKLANITEPILTMSSIYSNNFYEQNLLNYAWKLVFANQAHDSACTTCTDEAHEDIKNRYLKAIQVADELINYANKNIFANTKLNDDLGEPFIVYNLSPKNQDYNSELIVYSKNKNFKLVDENNVEIDFVLLEQNQVNKNFENIDFCNYISMLSFADDFKQQNKGQNFDGSNIYEYKNKIAIKNNYFNSIGYQILYISNTENDLVLDINGNWNKLENIFDTFTVEKNGTISIKTGNFDFKNLCYFESRGEAGDSYDFSPPVNDKFYTTLNETPMIKIISSGKNVVKVEVHYNWKLPESLVDNDQKRSDNLINNEINVIYTFRKDRIDFDVDVEFDNKSIEHIVSMNIDSSFEETTNIAGQQFGSIIRKNDLENESNWEQISRSKNYALYPFQRFVALKNENFGIGITTLDSSEYKIEDNKVIRTILFRSFNYMGKSNLVYRPGRPSGIYWKTPKSLMLTKLAYKFNVSLFNGNQEFKNFIALNNDVLNSIISFEVIRDVFFKVNDNQTNDHKKDFITLNKNEITISTIKMCEKENAYILRLYNSTDQNLKDIEVSININSNIFLSNIKESSIEFLNDNKIYIDEFKGNKIKSFKFFIK